MADAVTVFQSNQSSSSRPTEPERLVPAVPFIYEEGNLTSLRFEIDSIQSLMNKNAPDELMLSYTRVMMGFLLHNSRPAHIGIVGLGGGSLPKFCYKRLPRTRISVAEISSEVIALRGYFQIPGDNHRFRVFHEDGADFVRRQQAAFDVLMVDGFDMTGQPPQLCRQAFYEDSYRSLTECGILVVNLCDYDYRASVRRMRSVFDEVFVCECPDGTNRIAFALKRQDAGQWGRRHSKPANMRSLLAPVRTNAKGKRPVAAAANSIETHSKNA